MRSHSFRDLEWDGEKVYNDKSRHKKQQVEIPSGQNKDCSLKSVCERESFGCRHSTAESL